MSIAENLAQVRSRISEAALAAGRRPQDVHLIAVSKTKPVEAVRQALAAGQTLFGENYVQEVQEKAPALGEGPLWHFIGHLQTNKAKQAALYCHTIQTIDRLKLARALDRHAEEAGRILEVFLQVNVGGEDQKSGCTEGEAPALAEALVQLPNLRLKGLMTMPPFFDDPERVRPIFSRLRELSVRLAANLPAGSMEELSMGMSGDFEAAIKEGATLVRVGTAIFGAREYNS